MNTGTPIRLKLSAMTRSVTVLPVPVAPAISPWRLAIPGNSEQSMLPLAITSVSAIGKTSCILATYRGVISAFCLRIGAVSYINYRPCEWNGLITRQSHQMNRLGSCRAEGGAAIDLFEKNQRQNLKGDF